MRHLSVKHEMRKAVTNHEDVTSDITDVTFANICRLWLFKDICLLASDHTGIST